MDNLTKIKSFFLELFFPSFCLGCRTEGTFLCGDCRSALDISAYNYCLCGKDPLRLPAGNRNGKCSRCQDKKLAGVYSALPYKEKALTRNLIYQFKYEPYLTSLAKPLAAIVLEHLVAAQNNTEDIWRNSILIPVPLENKKLKQRGYNQSELLARELSQAINVPVTDNALLKTKETASQMKLSREKREQNLKNAFAVENAEAIKGKKVFLVDDVYTTGSTMEECARVLRTFGAKSVWGIAIAREG